MKLTKRSRTDAPTLDRAASAPLPTVQQTSAPASRSPERRERQRRLLGESGGFQAPAATQTRRSVPPQLQVLDGGLAAAPSASKGTQTDGPLHAAGPTQTPHTPEVAAAKVVDAIETESGQPLSKSKRKKMLKKITKALKKIGESALVTGIITGIGTGIVVGALGVPFSWPVLAVFLVVGTAVGLAYPKIRQWVRKKLGAHDKIGEMAAENQQLKAELANLRSDLARA